MRFDGPSLAALFSYWIRPYDWQRDARCWRWQRLPCRVLVLDHVPLPLRCPAAFSTPYGDRHCDLIAGHDGVHIRNDALGRAEYHWKNEKKD